MYFFEGASIVISCLLALFVFFEKEHFLPDIVKKSTYAIYWLMAVVFAASAFGNIRSAVRVEKILFAPVAAVLCFLCVLIAVSARL